MQKHERTHTGDKPYKCNMCDKEFTQVLHDIQQTELTRIMSQISNLKRHERVHAGEKPHECEICQKKFSTASNLKQHMHIHEKGVNTVLIKQFQIYFPRRRSERSISVKFAIRPTFTVRVSESISLNTKKRE